MFRYDHKLRAELRDNWLILAVTFSCFLFGTSAPAFALPFLFPEVIKEFGWTREQAALLASSKYAAGAVAALVVGRLVDVAGAWLVLMALAVIGGGAMASFLWIADLSSYYLAGVLLGVCGSGATVAIQALLSRVFHESQGTAIGFTMLGTSLGSMIWPLIAAFAIEASGWRTGFALLSSGFWIIVLPMLIAGLFARSLKSGRRAAPVARAQTAGLGTTLEAIRTRPFWLLAIALFLTALVDQAFIQHQVLMLKDMGVSEVVVAIGISLIGAISFIGRVLIGNFLDTKSTKGLAFLYLTLAISSGMALWLASPVVFIGYVVLRAIAHTTIVVDSPIMTKHVFGTANVGTMLGIFSAFVYAGFAVGPWLMGVIYDSTGSYTTAFILFAILPVIGSMLIWQLKPTYWLARRTQSIG